MQLGGAGHAQGMITSLKNNKRNRKTTFDKDVLEYKEGYGKLVDHKKMTPKEFSKFREELQKIERKTQRKFYFIFSLSLLLIIALGIYFLFFF